MDPGLLVHLGGALVTVGAVLYATRDHSRRLAILEESSTDHEGRISNVEGKLSITMPAKAGR